MSEMNPLLLAPIYQDYIWGGSRISSRFSRPAAPERCAESWEVADRPEGQSVVVGGSHHGKTLRELVRQYGDALLGAQRASTIFPLLVKLIDARETLSVQVHPNNENAHHTGGEPKTEMWYILEADPGACVYAGFRPGVTPDVFRAALADNTVEALLNKLPVRAGDAIFMPGGCVHAIGAGCLILECQQNSNTTYRLYDWGRVDAQGRGRELHIEPALKVINWDAAPAELARPQRHIAHGGNEWWEVVHSDFFRMQRVNLAQNEVLKQEPSSFRVLFIAGGSIEVTGPHYDQVVESGQTLLIPAACGDLVLRPVDGACVAMLMDIPGAD